MAIVEDSQIDKISELVRISDEILADFEQGSIPLEQIIPKWLRVARLRNDFDSIKWLTLELNGYAYENLIPGITDADKSNFAQRSGRYHVVKNEETGTSKNMYFTQPVGEIEADILCNQQYLGNLHTPTSYQPAINKTSTASNQMMGMGSSSSEQVVETLGNVLNNIRLQKDNLLSAIKASTSLLAKIRSSIYNYVLDINYQVKFENITESIFQTTKADVDAQLTRICPDAIKKFVAAYERLRSNNPEEWSQAMSSCRNVLKEFADSVFPAQRKNYKKRNGDVLEVTDDKYKNRLLAFIDKNTIGDKTKFYSSRISDLESRIHTLNDLLSKGTHEGLNLIDVKMCVLDTYFMIGSLLGLTVEESK